MAGLNDNTSEIFSINSAKKIKEFKKTCQNTKVNIASYTTTDVSQAITGQKIWDKIPPPPDYSYCQYDISQNSDSHTLANFMYPSVTNNEYPLLKSSGHIVMWSLQRDTPCGNGESDSSVSVSCAASDPSLNTPMEFSRMFQKTQHSALQN